MLRYAGIGSRETPEGVLIEMNYIAQHLSDKWILRSGYAGGADKAFFDGANDRHGPMEMFIPWLGFNGAPRNDPRFIVPEFTKELMDLAEQNHPAWHRCSVGARKLHARNGCQILGRDLSMPSDMVVCWTPRGAAGGGTGQAIRLAHKHRIPVFDLAIPGTSRKLWDFVQANGV